MGAWQEIVDYTVLSNTTSVVLNNFGTITKDDFIKIVVTFQNGTGGLTDSNYFLHPNGNTTAGNYRHQRLRGFGSSTAADQADNALIGFAQRDSGAEKGQSFIYCKLTENNYFTHFANNNIDDTGQNLQLQFIYSTSEVTFASGVTSFTITASVTNGIGTGSRIQIYRLGAEKVVDVIVPSNAFIVELSNLNIDKDSEYLLITDLQNVTTGFRNMVIHPNERNPAAGLGFNYFSQNLFASTTSISSNRNANTTFTNMAPQTRSLAYSHIKISNIGVFTVQSSTIRNYGTSTPAIFNAVVVSEFEDLENITELSMNPGNTNVFGTQSRFTLYKLYE